MAYDIPDHYQIQYENNWISEIQRMGSKLLGSVTRTEISGDRKQFNFTNKRSLARKLTKNAKTVDSGVETFLRFIFANPYDDAALVDEWESKNLGALASPESQIMRDQVYAYNRTADGIILDALGGNANAGENGLTAVPLPAAQIIEADYDRVGTATGTAKNMTLAKVQRAKLLMDNDDVPMDGRFFVISPDAEQSLIANVAEVKSRDFASNEVISSGSLNGKYWMGFNWICTSQVAETDRITSDIAKCYAFHKDFIVFGDGERRAYMDILPENTHSMQVRVAARMGAARLQEEGVVEVEIDVTENI